MLQTKSIHHISRNFYKLYKLSFPKEERLPFRYLYRHVHNKNNSLLLYYDDEKYIGFTLSIKFDNYICLAFFATNPEYRNKGYGTQILNLYLENNSKEIVFLNCESFDNEEDIKYRRYSFYLRNGFLKIPLLLLYNNIEYLTLANRSLSKEEITLLRDAFIKKKCDCRIEKNI